MSSQTIKIDGARFILTLDPERRIITDASVLVEGNRIVRVGKAWELESTPADRVIDAREMVLTPGFCNGHVHISYAHATRGIFPDDLQPGDYLSKVFTLQSAMNEEEEYYTSFLAITELLRYGTTCFVDPGTTKFLDACMQAYEDSGCRIVLGSQVVDLPNPLNLQVATTEEAISLMEKTIRNYDHRLGGRVRAWAMPYSMDYASEELLVAAKRLADEYQTGMTLHQANAAASIRASVEKHGKRPVEYLEEIGVLGPNLLLAHVIGLDASEADCVARTGTKAVVCPTAAMKMGQGLGGRSILPEILARGVCVGLGTDAGNNSNLLETLRSVYLIAVVFNDARQITGVVPAETALEMATIQGAKAMGLDDEIGSIEVGKKADLVLFDTMRPEWRTIFNPVNNLVYNSDGRSVHTVIVDGRIVVEDHRPVFVDERQLIQKTQELGEQLLSRTGITVPQRWPVI